MAVHSGLLDFINHIETFGLLNQIIVHRIWGLLWFLWGCVWKASLNWLTSNDASHFQDSFCSSLSLPSKLWISLPAWARMEFRRHLELTYSWQLNQTFLGPKHFWSIGIWEPSNYPSCGSQLNKPSQFVLALGSSFALCTSLYCSIYKIFTTSISVNFVRLSSLSHMIQRTEILLGRFKGNHKEG